ncbi:DUF1932 domain-containing protein [Caulobacter sp. 73W]|uniref:DUF1932 domain-containing protein n=1 Tax=Caulobacter sp. 73W TaxID=3161137 RepID=A0AB39KXY7_9CAUL
MTAPVLAFLGFGEAAQAFVEGWGDAPPARLAAFDLKTEGAGRDQKLAEYDRAKVRPALTPAEAVSDAQFIISVVTADEAVNAARAAARALAPRAVYFDFNSVAPAAKQEAAALIEAAGGRYVDVAVMSPVRPALLKTPMLVSGSAASEAADLLARLGFSTRPVEGGVGGASAIKMIRSIMIKGIEALTAECVLSAYAAGVEDEVFASLDGSFPGFDWRKRADYNLDRMIVHGRRRAAEMRESAKTAAGLGLGGETATATAGWQQRIGDLELPLPDGLDAKVQALLSALESAR